MWPLGVWISLLWILILNIFLSLQILLFFKLYLKKQDVEDCLWTAVLDEMSMDCLWTAALDEMNTYRISQGIVT